MVIAGIDTNLKTRNLERAPVPCSHCGLPVPRGLIDCLESEQFCCSGCETAYHLIHACGLDAFYSMAEKESFTTRRNPVTNPPASGFSDYDQPAFLSTFAKSINQDVLEIQLSLDGIHCAACIWLIEKLPQIVPGVTAVQLNWARRTVRIRWSASLTRLSRIASTLHDLGYHPHPFRASETENRRQIENRQQLARIGVAAAAAGNNMLIAGALYLGMFSFMSVDMTQLLRLTSCVVGLAALFGPGRVFLRGAISAIRTRTSHMDLPIALGLVVGSAAGLVNTVRGSGEIYFDSLSVLIFLLLVGRWIQFRQQNQAADAVELLFRLTPQQTRRIVDGKSTETFVEMINQGDLLEIRPGDLLPVDAVIVEGTTDIDESILTGESRLLRKTIGDPVLAGTQNLNSLIIVRTTATGHETRLGKIVEQVELASLDKPQIVEWANRIGGYFVVVVIGLSAIVFVSWLRIDASVAIDRAVALLIVACPCALALATPLAISVGLGRAARQKILVKGGDILQILNRPGMIWLDKTGTLTEGQLEVSRWYGNTRYLSVVAALENRSSHPVAKAIVDYVGKRSEEAGLVDIEDLQELPGLGISGRVFGNHILVGNAKLLQDHNVRISRRQRQIATRLVNAGFSPCWVASHQTVVAIIALGDRIRTDAEPLLAQLKSAGWQIGILSGDHETIVQRVACRLGINHELALGGLSPEDKVAIIRGSTNRNLAILNSENQIRNQRLPVLSSQTSNNRLNAWIEKPWELFHHNQTVVMVGDGVNDSAALAAASAGIAVHSGAEASLAAAPVYLAEAGLGPILKLLKISNSTAKTIRQNFAVSIGYNLFGAALAACGFVNPLIAALLMPISSLTVVAISLTAGSHNSSLVEQSEARS